MKAIGVLIIGLGLILIVIGIQGTQSKILDDIKNLNPALRSATGTTNGAKATSKNSGGNSGVTAT
jgi:uncharacterized protein YoxC